MREVFHQSLEDVQSRLVEISELVIVAIDKATRAFSTSDVALAEEVIEEDEVIDDKARLTLSGTGAAGSSLLTNDNAIPYKGSGYERVMVHEFQAFNYLGLGDAQGATVELRRASGVLST